MAENSTIVPFGKYKGQPLEIMLSDANYISYQKQQPGFMKWLQDNHITIYNIFTTGAQQVQDTPEHNKLQARFLDKKFQIALIASIYKNSFQDKCLDPAALKISASFEHGYDVHLKISSNSPFAINEFRIEIKPCVGDDYPAVLRQMKINQPYSNLGTKTVQLENGSLVRIPFCFDVLLIGKFESESINIEQLRGIFGRYEIVLLSEIEEKMASYTL